MGLITEKVEASWSPSNRKWYELKGYIFTGYNNKFIVNITDLSDGCNLKVECMCDNCHKVTNTQWILYKRTVKCDNKTYCNKCSRLLFGIENIRISKLNKGVSFERWCIDNNRKDLLDRWDYELNKYNPNEVSYGTKIKTWFKCPYGIHNSELKNIYSITENNNKTICHQCNSFGQWLINNYGDNAVELYWSNKNTINPFEIAHCSRQKAWLICQNCKSEKLIPLNTFIYYELMCSKCSDGKSYPNKFAFNLLEQLGLDFITEYSPDWIKPKKYDFYFEKDNKKYILEMDGGLGHGNKTYSKSNLTIEETLEIDRFKDKLAQENNITVIRIDCYYSFNNKFNFIKNNILNSIFADIFDLSNVDWNDCHRNACNSLIKNVCDFYNSYTMDLDIIAHKFKINKTTVRRYLKLGAEISLCKYNPKEVMIQNFKNKSKKVYCIELNKVFNSIREVKFKMNIFDGNISACCKGNPRHKSAGGYHWMYYDEYIKQIEKEV